MKTTGRGTLMLHEETLSQHMLHISVFLASF